MITINAMNLIYAAKAKHKRSAITERKGKRLPDRNFVTSCTVVDHRCGVLTRK